MKILFGINCYETKDVWHRLESTYRKFMVHLYRGYYKGIPARQPKGNGGGWVFPCEPFDNWLKSMQEKLNGIK